MSQSIFDGAHVIDSRQTAQLCRLGRKTRMFLIVDNFAMVNGRKACDMSEVSEFCLEKGIKLAYQCI